MWYLIVSIPDLCTLTYMDEMHFMRDVVQNVSWVGSMYGSIVG